MFLRLELTGEQVGREESGKMVLESTMVCVDNSEYMQNGDFLPTRLQAQQDAVNIRTTWALSHWLTTTLAISCPSYTLSSPRARSPSALASAWPIWARITRCASLPLWEEKVNVDIINFGEEEVNTEKLTAFVNTLNGKDGTSSHLVTVPPGPSLADALISSLILASEGGAMLGLGASDFEFGVDPSADPELALALRVSMEDQRQRQEEEARRAAAASAAETGIATTGTEDSGDALLKMTISQQEFGRTGFPDLSSMTEEEQIAYAMQMSLLGAEFGQAQSADIDASSAMDTSEPAMEEDDYNVMQDPEFLQSVLENLPGVDPNNEAIRNATGSLASQATKDGKKDKKEEDKK
uniref:26S proteasome non-ATPase regulatory subunit 4 n=1 Tax=Cebus imitator TaxID=2715852 RepID=A0A2K5PBF5_CEBIM